MTVGGHRPPLQYGVFRILDLESPTADLHKDLQERLSILKNRFLLSLIFLTNRRSAIPNLKSEKPILDRSVHRPLLSTPTQMLRSCRAGGTSMHHRAILCHSSKGSSYTKIPIWLTGGPCSASPEPSQ